MNPGPGTHPGPIIASTDSRPRSPPGRLGRPSTQSVEPSTSRLGDHGPSAVSSAEGPSSTRPALLLPAREGADDARGYLKRLGVIFKYLGVSSYNFRVVYAAGSASMNGLPARPES